MDKNIGAFFDIDGTLYRGSLMIEHFKKLIKYEVVDPLNWHFNVKKSYEEWKKRTGEFDDYIETLAEIYIDSLKGLNKERMDFIVDQVINLKGEQVYSYVRDRIEFHRRMGHKVFFISGSPDFLVEKMAEKYKVTEFIGTIYMVDENGCFTGEIKPMWDSENKNRAIDHLIEKHQIDLAQSYAYGDTNGDLSMLRKIGIPIAINPNYELLEQLKNDPILSDKTKVIVERKDVIYELDPKVSIMNRD